MYLIKKDHNVSGISEAGALTNLLFINMIYFIPAYFETYAASLAKFQLNKMKLNIACGHIVEIHRNLYAE